MSGLTAINNITSADKGDDEYVFILLTDNYYPIVIQRSAKKDRLMFVSLSVFRKKVFLCKILIFTQSLIHVSVSISPTNIEFNHDIDSLCFTEKH